MTGFVEQITRGYWQTERRQRNTGRHWPGPILFTEGQARQLFGEAYPGVRSKDEEDEIVEAARRGEARLFHLPVQLVECDCESTPYLEGWI